MTLAGYYVENYKGFAEPAKIELRPLTLLFGFNSSGKSALLRLLPLLRESILSNARGPLALSSEAARGASFSDLKSQFSSSPVVTLRLEWGPAEAAPYPLAAEFSIRDIPEFRTQVVEKLKLWYSNEEEVQFEWIPSASQGVLSSQYQISGNKVEPGEISIRFEGMCPVVAPSEARPTDVFLRFRALAYALQRFAKGVYWLQALRSLPPRREDFTGLSGRFSSNGAEITQMLLEDESRGGQVLEEVSRWYDATTNHRLELRKGSFRGPSSFDGSYGTIKLLLMVRGDSRRR